MRDAKIRLAQGDTVSFDDDVGIVPLLYLAGEYRLSDRWTIAADLDGLAGGPGRVIDLGVAPDFSITKRWRVGAEVRVLDGGADTDEVYDFARFNSAALAISTDF